LYGTDSMKSLVQLFVLILTFASLVGARPAGAEPEAEVADAPPVERTMTRYGSSAFSFEVPDDWQPITGTDAVIARLHYIAQLREVLDAPPDVPADSFNSVMAFAAFRIAESDGYMVATLIDMAAPPQRIFDVIHLHGRGRNDWGQSLYITVEEVLRNERHATSGEPAIAIDVHMSGGLSIAAKYFRVPSDFHRIGGITVLLPRDDWEAIDPIVDQIRSSIRVGLSNEPPGAQAPPITAGNDALWATVEVEKAARAAARAGADRARVAIPEQRGAVVSAFGLASRLIVLALAYAIVFFVTLRMIYFAIISAGKYVSPELDIDAYREAADKDPWTLGLLKSEGMIMLCAITSMAFAGILLYFFLRF